MQTIRPRKQPERRCIGCGEHFPKKELIRIVRRPTGEIVLDLTGKVSGRGAYVCPRLACLRHARKARRAENALECVIPEEVYDQMEAELDRED